MVILNRKVPITLKKLQALIPRLRPDFLGFMKSNRMKEIEERDMKEKSILITILSY